MGLGGVSGVAHPANLLSSGYCRTKLDGHAVGLQVREHDQCSVALDGNEVAGWMVAVNSSDLLIQMTHFCCHNNPTTRCDNAYAIGAIVPNRRWPKGGCAAAVPSHDGEVKRVPLSRNRRVVVSECRVAALNDVPA